MSVAVASRQRGAKPTTSRPFLRRVAEAVRPDPLLSVADWAEAHRVLPPTASAKPGPWRTARVPYLRSVMEAVSPSSPYETVVLMAGAQCGKSEAALNLLGFVIDQAPGPVLLVQPTVALAERFSRQRVQTMIDATPRLRGKVAPRRTRDSGHTLLSKEFRNGILVLTGANSATGLRSMPAAYVLLDEVDAFPGDVEGEGDPVALAQARTETYVRSKTLMTSTPKTQGLSRIELALEQCDRRFEYRVACPHCRHAQPLVFEQLRWPEGKPDAAAYACIACGELMEHRHKPAMVKAGEWVAIKDEGTRSAGFALNQLYSIIGKTTWAKIAREYERAKDQPELLRAFVNVRLGLPFAEKAEAPKWSNLYARRERYEMGMAPLGVVFLTAGVDVQKDRLELEVVGWGRGKESWSVAYEVLDGDPARPEVWAALDAVLAREWPHACGRTLPIRVLCVDSGYATAHVYAWAREHPQPAFGPAGAAVRTPRTVAACKGMDTWMSIVRNPARADSGPQRRRSLRVWPVGASVAKRELYDFLRLEPPTDADRAAGKPYPPGFVHFPEYGEEWFKQLTAERLVKRVHRGFPREGWEKDPGARNEALDIRVLNRAAAAIYGIERLSDRAWTRLEVEAGLPRSSSLSPATSTVIRPAPATDTTSDPAPTPARSEGSPGWKQGDQPPREPEPPPRPARKFVSHYMQRGRMFPRQSPW